MRLLLRLDGFGAGSSHRRSRGLDEDSHRECSQGRTTLFYLTRPDSGQRWPCIIDCLAPGRRVAAPPGRRLIRTRLGCLDRPLVGASVASAVGPPGRAAAPALVGKPKRKGARSAKHAEPEVVPGVTGVQTALDLRSPDKKERQRAAEAAPVAVIRAAHAEPSAESFASVEKSERPTLHRAEKGGEPPVDVDNAPEKTEPQQNHDEQHQVARAADTGR